MQDTAVFIHIVSLIFKKVKGKPLHCPNIVWGLTWHDRQANVDYSVSESLKQISATLPVPLHKLTDGLKASDKTLVLFIYDIACQWTVHHKDRFVNPFLTLPENIELLAAVGKFHLGAHVLECFWRFALEFIKGGGQIDGEVMETSWAELDKVAGFVCGMLTAHRQEVLDDFLMDSNWKKLIGMPDFLTSKLDRAQAGFMAAKQTFEELSMSVGEKWVRKWGRLERLAFSEGGVGNRIYEAAETRSMCLSSQYD